jgi:hypothetical protein
MDFVTPTGFPVVFEYAEIVTSTAVAAAACWHESHGAAEVTGVTPMLLMKRFG